MPAIKKGDRVVVPDARETLVASRDEYNSRVWLMTEREYQLRIQPGGPDGEEEPYLIMPDGTLVRDYQHGFPDRVV